MRDNFYYFNRFAARKPKLRHTCDKLATFRAGGGGVEASALPPPYQFNLFASHHQLDEIIYTGTDDTAAGRKARVLG
jgi:hypothetical protein